MTNPEFGPLTERVQWQIALKGAALDPIDETEYLIDIVNGTEDPRDRIEIGDITLTKARLFLYDVKEAIINANIHWPLLRALEQDVYEGSEYETLFEHEFEHVKKASELLKRRLRECKLDAVFTLGPQGFGASLGFTIPEDIDPISKILITLAPRELSDPDRYKFYDLLKEHQDIVSLQDGLMEDLALQYEQKSGFTFNSSLLEVS